MCRERIFVIDLRELPDRNYLTSINKINDEKDNYQISGNIDNNVNVSVLQ